MPISFHRGEPNRRRPKMAPNATTPHEARLAREREMLEVGRGELRQGLGADIDDPEMSAWLDSLDGDEDVPPPEPRSIPASGR